MFFGNKNAAASSAHPGPPGQPASALAGPPAAAAASQPSPLPARNGRVQASAASVPAPSTAQPAVSQEEMQRRAAVAIRQSLAFAQIVSVLSRSPTHKFFTLADLEWLVIPPLMTGQFAVAEAKAQADGPAVPVAVVLWASVSEAVDERLSENLSVPIRLRPDEWRSGEVLWLVEAVGDSRVVPGLLKQLEGKAWNGRTAKFCSIGEGGSSRLLKNPERT